MSLFLKFNNAVAIGIVRYTAITNMLNHGFIKLMLNSAEISLVKEFLLATSLLPPPRSAMS
jgi:two-component sensor histidine kinase